MTSERKVLWAIVAGVFALVVFLVLAERVDEELVPRAQRALVAIEPSGTGLATTGRVELDSGTPFTLHAVLEAESWTGETIYFTDAQRLRLEGEEVSPRSLRRFGCSATPAAGGGLPPPTSVRRSSGASQNTSHL